MNTIILFSVIKCVATLPWIGDIVKTIGGKNVKVDIIVHPQSDPHKVYLKPSMIIKFKKAEVLFYNGLDLEIGYLPYLIEKSGNPRIMPGAEYNVDLSRFVPLILEKPKGKVTREMGDVHPYGNPHYHLDPLNIIAIADSLKNFFSRIDPGSVEYYQKNFNNFKKELKDSLKSWREKYRILENKKFVSYHKLYEYLAYRFGFKIIGYIEPKPGIPPSPGYIKKLVEKIKKEKVSLILSSVYYDKKAPEKLRRLTGINYVILPHDVGSIKGTENYISLISKILKVIKGGFELD